MLQKVRWQLASFLQGRYGNDILNKYLIILTLILLGIGSFVRPLRYLSFFLLIYVYFRSFSRNIKQRGVENYKFVILKNKVMKPLKDWKLLFIGDKQAKYYRCQNCRQILRVPRKAPVEIRCPRCRKTFYNN